ncbi:tetratricopeptide repeat protein [Nocardioides humi]|uniref:AAA+ ATPase domain-containing protein n=1 Tax=Nocardioides humi TaxID=449461 RepID=A0ABN1ZS40_9ACTN|nr:tetratricopeptide repeat protein [Nocardioides humi]
MGRVARPRAPAGASGFDAIAVALQELRGRAGHPSYAEIARLVSDARAASGVPPGEARVAKSTVYDIFRTGRQRLDSDLVAEVVAVLGADAAEAARWAEECRRAQQAHAAQESAGVRADLPPEEHFVGRDDHVARIAAAEPGAVFAITGLAGAGKTTLAVEAARRLLADGRSDGVLLADLRGFDADLPPAAPRAVAAGLLRLLGDSSRVPGDPAEAVAALAGELAADDPRVLVLDDAADTEQVVALAGCNPSGITLVTSRRRLELSDTDTIELGDLDAADAARLLSEIAGHSDDATDPAALQIVTATGLLPLTVSLTAGRMAQRVGWSMADHLAALAERPARLGDDLHAGLEASYQLLAPASRAVLRQLADQPCADLTLVQVAALTGRAESEAASVLAELRELHLVGMSGPRRFALHDAVRMFARDQAIELDRPSDRVAALGRLARHLLVMAWSAHRARFDGVPWEYQPPDDLDLVALDDDEGRAWLADNVDSVLAIAQSGARIGRPLLGCELSGATTWWLNHTLRLHDAEQLHRQAIAAAEAGGTDRPGTSMLLARARLGLGQTLAFLARFEEAATVLETARSELVAADDAGGERKAVNALSVIATMQGRHDDAIAGFQRAAELASRIGDLFGESQAVDNLSVVHHRSGRPELAVAASRRAQALAEQLGDLDQLTDYVLNMVDPLLAMGDATAARDAARRGVDLARRRGHPSLPRGLANLALASEALGEYGETRAHLLEALDNSVQTGLRSGQIEILTELGRLDLRLGETETARGHYAAAAQVAEESDIPLGVARATEGLGSVAEASGDSALAHRHWRRALELFEQVGSEEAAPLRERLRS